jgi:hypothetical protein
MIPMDGRKGCLKIKKNCYSAETGKTGGHCRNELTRLVQRQTKPVIELTKIFQPADALDINLNIEFSLHLQKKIDHTQRIDSKIISEREPPVQQLLVNSQSFRNHLFKTFKRHSIPFHFYTIADTEERFKFSLPDRKKITPRSYP